MAHTLVKDKKVVFKPGHSAVPAYPGQPWMPAYYSTEYMRQCAWKPTTVFSGNAVGYGWVKIPADPVTGTKEHYEQVLVDAYGNPASGSVTTTYIQVCETKEYQVYHAEQPYIAPRSEVAATASETILDLNLGWNAGARSVGFLGGGGKADFKMLPSVIGAVVGLNDAGVDAGYINIEHAWYFSHGIARIFELGAAVFYSGPYVLGDKFTVKRVNGRAKYYKNDVLEYESVALISTAMFLDASLYAGDDSVYDPELTDLGYSDVTMSPMVGLGYGAGATHHSFSNASMLPMTISTRVASRGNASMLPLVGLAADRVYGQSAGVFEPMTVFAQGGMPVPDFAIANVAMLYLTAGTSHGLTGTIGGSSGSMAPMDGLGSEGVYGESVISMLPMVGVGYAYEGNNNASMLTSFGAFGSLSAPIERLVVMTSDMTMATFVEVSRLVDAEMQSSFSMATEMEFVAALRAVMNTLVMMSFGVPTFDSVSQAWVVNANTGASSRYEDFPFTSYGKIGGRYYGCLSDGIYLLEGETDASLPIRASVDFGNNSYGTSRLKGCPSAYLGVSSSGGMFLKVVANDREYLYKARSYSDDFKTHRVDLGRGLRANYLRFELYNSDGCDFELDSVEFLIVPQSRRI